MITLLATALMAFSGGAVEYTDKYVAPFEMSITTNYDFNSMYAIAGTTTRYIQTFSDTLTLTGSLDIPKQSVSGIYLYTLKLQGYDLKVYNTSSVHTNPVLINTSTGVLDTAVSVDDFSNIYHVFRPSSSVLRWDYSLYSSRLDEDIIYVSNSANVAFTSGITPVNHIDFAIDIEVIRTKIDAFAKQYVNNDYGNGYLDGYDAGKIFQRTEDTRNIAEIEENAYNDGYDAGRRYGYNEGVHDGNNNGANLTTLFWSVIDEPFAIIYRLLNFEVLGVNVMAFVSGLVTLGLIGFVIKMII